MAQAKLPPKYPVVEEASFTQLWPCEGVSDSSPQKEREGDGKEGEKEKKRKHIKGQNYHKQPFQGTRHPHSKLSIFANPPLHLIFWPLSFAFKSLPGDNEANLIAAVVVLLSMNDIMD